MADQKAQLSHQKGLESEKLAATYLQSKGYQLLSKNFRIRGGEIDLIMQKGGILTFVEVKARSQTRFGSALESITRQKKRLLLRSIATYLVQNKVKTTWQLDVITIHYQNSNKAFITHYKNIFIYE